MDNAQCAGGFLVEAGEELSFAPLVTYVVSAPLLCELKGQTMST